MNPTRVPACVVQRTRTRTRTPGRLIEELPLLVPLPLLPPSVSSFPLLSPGERGRLGWCLWRLSHGPPRGRSNRHHVASDREDRRRRRRRSRSRRSPTERHNVALLRSGGSGGRSQGGGRIEHRQLASPLPLSRRLHHSLHATPCDLPAAALCACSPWQVKPGPIDYTIQCVARKHVH